VGTGSIKERLALPAKMSCVGRASVVEVASATKTS